MSGRRSGPRASMAAGGSGTKCCWTWSLGPSADAACAHCWDWYGRQRACVVAMYSAQGSLSTKCQCFQCSNGGVGSQNRLSREYADHRILLEIGQHFSSRRQSIHEGLGSVRMGSSSDKMTSGAGETGKCPDPGAKIGRMWFIAEAQRLRSAHFAALENGENHPVADPFLLRKHISDFHHTRALMILYRSVMYQG